MDDVAVGEAAVAGEVLLEVSGEAVVGGDDAVDGDALSGGGGVLSGDGAVDGGGDGVEGSLRIVGADADAAGGADEELVLGGGDERVRAEL